MKNGLNAALVAIIFIAVIVTLLTNYSAIKHVYSAVERTSRPILVEDKNTLERVQARCSDNKTPCFSFIYPITVSVTSKETITIHNANELQQFRKRDEKYSIQFPVYINFLKTEQQRLKLNEPRVNFIIYTSLSHLIIFILFSFLNFKFRTANFWVLLNSRFLKISIFILMNMLLYILCIYCEGWFFQYLERGYSYTRPIPTAHLFQSNLPIVLLAISLSYVLHLIHTKRQTELESSKLREEIVSAELAVLRKHVSPHFFFNTLSSLSSTVRNESREISLEYIQQLSNTYRYTLSSSKLDLVTLKEELDFVNSYIYVLNKRFGDKLLFNIDIPNTFFEFQLPPVSIQLLIENAVQHNIISKSAPLIITILIEEKRVWVMNNIQERKDHSGLGTGLKNLSNRYKLLLNQDIGIIKTEHMFKVSLPLL